MQNQDPIVVTTGEDLVEVWFPDTWCIGRQYLWLLPHFCAYSRIDNHCVRINLEMGIR